jgi:hypothetical protein
MSAPTYDAKGNPIPLTYPNETFQTTQSTLDKNNFPLAVGEIASFTGTVQAVGGGCTPGYIQSYSVIQLPNGATVYTPGTVYAVGTTPTVDVTIEEFQPDNPNQVNSLISGGEYTFNVPAGQMTYVS